MPKKNAAIPEEFSASVGIDASGVPSRTRYFFPTIGDGVSVEAESLEEALEQASKLK